LIEHPEFTETIVDLDPGDALLLYTDGLLAQQRRTATLNSRAPERMLDHPRPVPRRCSGHFKSSVPRKQQRFLPDDVRRWPSAEQLSKIFVSSKLYCLARETVISLMPKTKETVQTQTESAFETVSA
jgi:hypothetical protein